MGMTKEERLEEMEEVWTMMGLTLTIFHEIEYHLSQAFLLGINERARRQNKTIKEIMSDRGKMTFGRMIGVMKEEWSLHPIFEMFIDAFVKERNIFIHKLTTLDGYNVLYKRDRKRLKKRLAGFIEVSMLAQKIFESAWFVSMAFGVRLAEKEEGKKIPFDIPPEIAEGIKEFLFFCDWQPAAAQ